MLKEILRMLIMPLTLMTLFLIVGLMPLYLMAGLIRMSLDSQESVPQESSSLR
tara:strand:- start:251 stop:409 length:159 start_codon:yes stop_codon:yes gene_type:complete